ncbi:MAG: energy-coupling factor transporter transmembrane protein EcfT [Candidatus Marinimicrobia bacterium]|nr:energy-coupling factor transporter transmembrane protein EcfT [Candidatus Neomarinimicrobiota bacterium]
MTNPFVTALFYLGFAFSAILTDAWSGLIIYLIICIILIILNIDHLKSAYKQVKPFFLFFPIMIIVYLFISFIFTNSTWTVIFNEAGFTISKLLLLVIVMAVYLEISKKQNLILSVRSIWSKLNLKWKWVEDLFMFLELTLRFYPTFQREWQSINRSKKALGLTTSTSKWEQIKSVTNDLPGMILQSYRRAENTAIVMQQRGYGNQIPRGVANPILFKISDLILIVIIIAGYTLLNQYVAL